MLFSDCIAEYVLDMQAAGRSRHTIADYSVAFRWWLRVIGDLPMESITRRHVRQFMRAMAEDTSAPAGVAPRPARRRSPKTLRNYHTALAALWTWAQAEHIVTAHVIRQVQAPRAPQQPVQPFTPEEIQRLAGSCQRSRPWASRPLTTTEKATATRDLAIILLLVDTGLRNAELRQLRLQDLQLGQGQAVVRHGKGNKQRVVYFGRQARRALRAWLQDRPAEAAQHGDHVFCNVLRYKGQAMTGNNLNKLLARVGDRAGVAGVHVHRFRHTAAVLRLRAGFNAFQLKEMLGHSDMAMTMRYVHAAGLDMAAAATRTSPVDNLRL